MPPQPMPPAGPRAPGLFATSGVPAARRVEPRESHNATALIGLGVRTARPLEATEVNVQRPLKPDDGKRPGQERPHGPAHRPAPDGDRR